MSKKSVLIGMSGGVDSSVAAYLLKEQGYDVIGVTMKLYEDENIDSNIVREDTCCGLTAIEDARKVCNIIGMPLYTLNYKKIFEEKVIKEFVKEYRKGRTPNPCISCNRYVRFPYLLQKANELGIDYISTGHYARIERDNNGKYHLYKSKEKRKDQTYMLYGLNQEILSRTLFPLSSFNTKDEVREIAEKAGLIVAQKRDSQEICFVPDKKHHVFIEKYENSPLIGGSIIDKNGSVLGKHEGIEKYTIGQKKGLGISIGKPAYIVKIQDNNIVIGDEKDLYSESASVSNVNFISGKEEENFTASVKTRYSSKECKAKIKKINEDLYHIKFDISQKSITKGQSIVFYMGDELIGGGIIN